MEFIKNADEAVRAGFRFGDKGTHTSRTMMLTELAAALAVTAPQARRSDFAAQIIEANTLGKITVATRRSTNQRLGELYGLDPSVPLFRVMRDLWPQDEAGRPLLALLSALARDPLLAATTEAVIPLSVGQSLDRDRMDEVVRRQTGARLSDATIAKVIRNAASTWEQSGHLEGRTFKRRRAVSATPYALAFALYLGQAAGYRGEDLLTSPWVAALDCPPDQAWDLAQQARRIGLIDVRAFGDVVHIDTDRLDPFQRR